MRLDGKRTIVTGGASGFGAGIARKFVQEGAKVLIADLNLVGAEALAQELGSSAFACEANVANGENVKDMAAAAQKELGGVDILINNAGTTHLPAPMEEVSENDFDTVFEVNCKSVYLTAKYLVPIFKVQKSGCILHIASTAGVSPRPRLSWYNASKGWMNNATKGMAVELAPEGIRVNALNPVAGETPLLQKFLGGDTPENRQRFISTIPLGRFSTPQDLGNAACYLCSDEASMITGVCMEVDGGRCI